MALREPLISADPVVFHQDCLTPLTKEELFCSFFEVSGVFLLNLINKQALCDLLDQLLAYLASFKATDRLPVKELLCAKLDIALALLTHLDFVNYQSIIEDKLLALFEYLSFVPPVFMSRLVRLGVVEFVFEHLSHSNLADQGGSQSALMFVVNFGKACPEFVHYSHQKRVFDSIFAELEAILQEASARLGLISLFTHIGGSRGCSNMQWYSTLRGHSKRKFVPN